MNSLLGWLRNPRHYADGLPGVGLLFLRVWVGYAMMVHGSSKIQSPFSWMNGMPNHPPGFLQALAAASEFLGGLALLLGFLTPLAALAMMSVMFVATWANFLGGATMLVNPAPGGKSAENAFNYFALALVLFLTGPGRLSLDALLFGRQRSRAK